jgi:hypothetical protein
MKKYSLELFLIGILLGVVGFVSYIWMVGVEIDGVYLF